MPDTALTALTALTELTELTIFLIRLAYWSRFPSALPHVVYLLVMFFIEHNCPKPDGFYTIAKWCHFNYRSGNKKLEPNTIEELWSVIAVIAPITANMTGTLNGNLAHTIVKNFIVALRQYEIERGIGPVPPEPIQGAGVLA
jgi:hypothetical protein